MNSETARLIPTEVTGLFDFVGGITRSPVAPTPARGTPPLGPR
jgi:hypothetical protein